MYFTFEYRRFHWFFYLFVSPHNRRVLPCLPSDRPADGVYKAHNKHKAYMCVCVAQTRRIVMYLSTSKYDRSLRLVLVQGSNPPFRNPTNTSLSPRVISLAPCLTFPA